MLRLALLFLVIALIAGALGFGAVASLSFEAGRLLFYVFIALAIVFAVIHLVRGAAPRDSI